MFTVINRGHQVIITALVTEIPESKDFEFEYLKKKIYSVKSINFQKKYATIFDDENYFDLSFSNLKFYLNNEHIIF